MALTPAEKQRNYRQRLAVVVARGRELEAEGRAAPIPPLPMRHRARAEKVIALEIMVPLKALRRTAKIKRDAAALADAEAAIAAWEAVRARLLE